jgi:hypothetical protein
MLSWPPEVCVVCDMWLNLGGHVQDASNEPMPKADVKPYHMVWGTWTGPALNAGSYELWRSDPAPGPFGVGFSVERLDQSLREARHPDCPLCGCEDYDGRQRAVPVANGDIELRWPGQTITIDPRTVSGDDWVRIGDTTLRVTNVDHARRRIDVAAEYAGLGLISPSEVRELITGIRDGQPAARGARSRVPTHVQQHRPRLDGRRR